MLKRSLLPVCLMLWTVASASADTGPSTDLLRFEGYEYRLPGPGNAAELAAGFLEVGDGFEAIGVVTTWDECLIPPFDPERSEFTVYLSMPRVRETHVFLNLHAFDMDDGRIEVFYDRIADDGGTPAIPGIDPPNATVPSSYTDAGEHARLMLGGSVKSFQYVYSTGTEQGSWTGHVTWDEGQLLDHITPQRQGGWLVSSESRPRFMPVGFFALSQGGLRVKATCEAVPVQKPTWGAFKLMYR